MANTVTNRPAIGVGCPVCRQEVGHWYWCPYPEGRLRRLIFNLVRKVR